MIPRSRRSIPAMVLLLLALLWSGGCDTPSKTEQGDAPASVSPAGTSHEQLLMGYHLLARTLQEESRLKMLEIFKKVTLRRPVEEVSEIIAVLDSASEVRAKELKNLRPLDPDVSDDPRADIPIADAITEVALETGKQDMLDRKGPFNIRFVLLQAQATRMIAATATAIAEFEPNAERKAWLEEVAEEYEGYRNDIIEVVQKYVDGKGSAQIEEMR